MRTRPPITPANPKDHARPRAATPRRTEPAKGRPQDPGHPAGSAARAGGIPAALPTRLARLETLDLPALREEWSALFGRPAGFGRCKGLLRYSIAWRLQADALGGLSPWASQRLSRLMEATRRNPDYRVGGEFRLGTLLVREWKGVNHEVRVEDEGFVYGGERFGSLSEIARLITGTRWNGRLFFGLAKAERRSSAR